MVSARWNHPHTIEDLKTNISETIESINQITFLSGTKYGEMSECLHSGEWWALSAPFMNCISGFIELYLTYFVLL
jgi:hypothetical protein